MGRLARFERRVAAREKEFATGLQSMCKQEPLGETQWHIDDIATFHAAGGVRNVPKRYGPLCI